MALGAKGVAERILTRSPVPGILLRRSTPCLIVLSYHNVVPDGESAVGDRSLHVDQRVFGAHLDLLADSHDVVSLEALDGEPGFDTDRPRAVVTFDDAYTGAMTAGLEELRRRNLPATVFVAPGLLDEEGFWWDLLSSDSNGLVPALRQHALTALAGRQDRVLEWAAREGHPRRAVPHHARPVDRDGLDAAATSPLVALGAHTWSHPNLVALDDDGRQRELRRSHEWTLARPDETVDWLAYPYGLCNAEVAASTSRWFSGGLLVSGGMAVMRGRRRGDPLVTPRLNVPRGLSVDGLRLRLSGIGHTRA